MTDLLEDRTAVITGAASGIGRAIARRYAEEGADVVVADVREEPRSGGSPTHELIRAETGADARYCECDVREIDDLRVAVEAADEFGGVDTMVNNAGVTGPIGPFHEASVEAYERARATLLDGVFYGSKVAATKMLADETEGVVINVSSALSVEGYSDQVPYSGMKGGVRLFTYSMAADLGPEIRVNAVLPGLTETAMSADDAGMIDTAIEERFWENTPLGRTARPREIADGAVFMASDMASFVSGESLLVDGGLTNTGSV
ncbi:MAG: dehydrogenase [halophilic archaeon J07HB67]|jgi:Dehydrogenases with different specificities (related to short-chain alcohol dehydrogenases)|nr:MAG: dehydrogenase [halophilic archaeon J07HB67]